MTTDTNLSVLEKNLELISQTNRELAEKIANVQEISQPFDLLTAKSGDTIFSYGKIIVDDEIDPVDHASQCFLKLKNNEEDNFYMVFGLGLGYLFKRLAKSCRGKIVLFEPNIEILRIVLEIVDFSDELSKKNVAVANTLQEAYNHISTTFNFTYGSNIYTCALDSCIRMYPDLFKNMTERLEHANPSGIIEESFKLNIGPGKWSKDGWKTLDCYIDSADIKHDLRRFKTLPVKDNSIEKVFSSHCIEHIETCHLEYLMKELYRCMKPGSLMRLACPDADQAFDAYRNNDINWFKGIYTKGEIGAKLVNTFVSYSATEGGPPVEENVVKEKFESLSKDEFIEWAISLCDRTKTYIAHINGIYYEKLERILKEAGFENIERSSYKNSKDEELKGEGFDLHREVSLFVECNKPEK
jgi:hypothetical protein